MAGSRLLKQLGIGAVLAGIYYSTGRLGLNLALVHAHVTWVWPAGGVGLAAMLLFGWRAAPAVFLGALCIDADLDVLPLLGLATGRTLEAIAGAWLVRRYAGGRAAFDRAVPLFVFVQFGAITSATLGATCGMASLWLSGACRWDEVAGLWTLWWLGDVTGAILVTPVLVLWANQPALRLRGWRLAELCLLLALLLSATWVVFAATLWEEPHHPLTFLLIPLLLWLAFRFGPRETATGCLLVGFVAVASALAGQHSLPTPPHQDAVRLQLVFLATMAVMALVVAVVVRENQAAAAALQEAHDDLDRRVQERTARLLVANAGLAAEMAERRQAQRELTASEARFREILESAPDAMLVVDHGGRITMVNGQAERVFGHPRADLLGGRLEMLVPGPLRARYAQARDAYVAAPQVLALGEASELSGLRRDGTVFPIDISLSPLRTEGEPLVAMAVRDVTRRQQAEQERRANERLRHHVEALSRRTREIEIQNRMSDMLRAVGSAAEAYPLVPRFLQELFPHGSGCIYVFHRSRTFLVAVAPWGEAPPREEVIELDECWGLRRGQCHCVEDAQDGTACRHIQPPLPASWLCIPMFVKGEALGLFHLRGLRPAPGADSSCEYQQRLAQAAAEQIAAAVANARLQETLRQQASHDPLTGLLNRRTFEEALARELHRVQRRHSELAVLMIDLDHFKEFNDRFGHAAGDLVLGEVGQLLLRCLRQEDLVCRYGGEEVVVALPECGLDDARRRAEQLRVDIKAIHLEHGGARLPSASASIGVAMFPQHGSSQDELLGAADAALYRAKREGRDRVVVGKELG